MVVTTNPVISVFLMENPIKMDDLVEKPLFFGNTPNHHRKVRSHYPGLPSHRDQNHLFHAPHDGTTLHVPVRERSDY